MRAVLAAVMGWWRRWFGEEPQIADSGATPGDQLHAAQVMEELRRARESSRSAPRARPRSLRGVMNGPCSPRSARAPGKVPWYEVQRRQAAIRDELRDEYDEHRPAQRDRAGRTG
ncbi:MAG: hypothetical protein ACI8PZ_000050 [Myxococcota bacterium]|jgi:hypothetical protein